jgi:predicted nucleic acid-binding protein
MILCDTDIFIEVTDLTSMVIMKELSVNNIMTGDEHFEHVGMGFKQKP